MLEGARANDVAMYDFTDLFGRDGKHLRVQRRPLRARDKGNKKRRRAGVFEMVWTKYLDSGNLSGARGFEED